MSSLKHVYPCLAQEIIDDYQITSGTAVDIGTGPGYLGIELAKITDLTVYLLDIDPEAVQKAGENAKKAGVFSRVIPVVMNVEEMDFADNFFDLIISRGSFWFWDDQVKALSEIYRILKTGGIARIGGGLSRYLPSEIKKGLIEKRKKQMENPNFARVRSEDYCHQIVEKTGIKDYNLKFESFVGRWIELRK